MNVCDLEKSIFVGNIHSCVTEEILFELFLQVSSSHPSRHSSVQSSKDLLDKT